jgi:5-methyltetrahydropteroyltriglutamate--homocysteine methyltransferase
MTLPTESIGSIPRPPAPLEGIEQFRLGKLSQAKLDTLYEDALKDTIARLEATGSPVISDGEQTKSSFATYPLLNLSNIASDGVTIPFEDGHTRQLPKLTAGPFKYGIHASTYVKVAKRYAHNPVKQAVISASALSLLYPAEGISGYSRKAFITDLIRETVADNRTG